jgi:molybdopterin guanine dinucleotide-containing S/N-oxide reductase-like protein
MKRTLNALALTALLRALPSIIKSAARRDNRVRNHLASSNCVVQLRLRDGACARHYIFDHGRITARGGVHGSPDVDMVFKSAAVALSMMRPNPDHAVVIDALKNFKVTAGGHDREVVWFGELMNKVAAAGWKAGTAMRDGSTRYTALTNGGPIFVYIAGGKILRTTPLDLDSTDAPSWTIRARGRTFTPRRQAVSSPHALSLKSLVYSDKRILTPLKRVDFDPHGARNPQSRGISGYERISWDEALDLVSGEIRRMKRQYGPGAIALFNPAHHQWGNLNYWLSAMLRFGNLIGVTRMAFSPISWEGWYWGAMHHFGNSIRLGSPGFYGTVEDCLENAEMIVFWSSDPESTSGVYAGGEGTQRRQWAQSLGIPFVHIDPHYNKTAQLFGGKWIPIKPGTDPALALAIMHQWIVDGTYDKDYVERRTDGFAEWREYLLGITDGVAKTPEWQEAETGVPAKDARSLARAWGKRRTYLGAGGAGAGFGGACRSATGVQWARCMVQMMAMQGWGKPGVNFGNLQFGAPMDLNFYFPGYADGGISGDVINTASVMHNYARMPHLATINPVKQQIQRQHFPEAIIEGKCKSYPWDGMSIESQFPAYEYPLPGHSPVHMLYRYGASSLGTVCNSARMIEAYRHPSLEFVVNQSIWHENEVGFADLILPSCTALERWDICEWSNSSGYIVHNQNQLNHRMVVMQNPCIEPLGESRSDYRIFADILTRLGLGAIYTEGGCDELTWCKRIFDSSDLPKVVSWKDFLRKGYHVIPADPESMKVPLEMRWFAEGRKKDTPEPSPLPSQYIDEFGSGLPTQSSKFEFVPSSLKRHEAHDPARGALNRYVPSWEGPASGAEFATFPLQLVTSHPPYSFHTYNDGKGGTTNDLEDHRMLVDGHYYWVLRMNPVDAATRRLKHRDVVKVFNRRAAVLCAIDVSPLVLPGTVKAYESCAEYDPIRTPDGVVDRGGCLNLLTPARSITSTADGIAPNSCLVDVRIWKPQEAAEHAT